MVGMAEKASTAVEAANIVEQPGAGMVRAGSTKIKESCIN